MKNEETPQGMIAILTGPDGREVANAADFNTGRPAGFSQQQAQEIRAKQALALEAMEKLASPLLSKAIDAYDAEKIMNIMQQRNGCHVHIISVGYRDEDA